MVKVGLTGGIGSGKSTVAKVFVELGVPVYFADVEAKLILNSDFVKDNLKERFGSKVIAEDNQVDRKFLASIVFNDKEQLSYLNKLIHPLVEIHFKEWIESNSSYAYIVQEAANLFEAGFDKFFDKIITVSAPEEQRIGRVLKRDECNYDDVVARIKNQMSDEQRESRSDFVIDNSNGKLILQEIFEIDKILRKK